MIETTTPIRAHPPGRPAPIDCIRCAREQNSLAFQTRMRVTDPGTSAGDFRLRSWRYHGRPANGWKRYQVHLANLRKGIPRHTSRLHAKPAS